MSKLVRINDQFHDRLTSLAIQNRRSIGMQLEYMIDRMHQDSVAPKSEMISPKKDYGALLKHKK